MSVSHIELPDLQSLLWQLLDQVPAGSVTTYGRLADALGDRVAARWVGQILLHHDHAPNCNCHRVVRADGAVGAYAEPGPDRKRRRLAADGIRIVQGRVDLQRYSFDAFRSPRPLLRLRRYQETMRDKFSDRPPDRFPKSVGAVDVSYARNGDAVAAYGLFAVGANDEIDATPCWSTHLKRPVQFPYISSYLAFRELPILAELLEMVRRQNQLAEVVLVDGSGILHPRRSGIATMLGIELEMATIGVTKKRLCGDVDLAHLAPCEQRPVMLDGEVVGLALGPASGSKKPLFLSPGHRCDVAFCKRIAGALINSKTAARHRLLQPIYVVDRLSRSAAG